MKKFIAYINIFICILFGSCNSQPIPSDISPTIGEIFSRDAAIATSIENGSQALFNAQGGVFIENKVFTFNQGVWKNGEESIYIDHPDEETTLTALYPAYSGETLITHNPYDNDTLTDVLIAQSTFTDETDIQLEFRHLFSKLTVHIHSSIASTIDAVTITVPQINQIAPISGEFTTDGEHSTHFIDENSTGINSCSCIVPALENCALTLTFTFKNGEEKSHYLTHSFVSGHIYECHVNRPPGIRNAADLIAFAELINKEHTGNRKLSEFGEEIEGKMVYRLLNDLILTEEDCQRLSPIGNHASTPFNNTFDGEGHTISNLILPEEHMFSKYSGLFGHITSNGIVQNFKIDYASTISDSDCTCKYIGVIASSNDGTINNCSVTNSTINHKKNGEGIGLICGISNGTIINCYTKDNNIYLANPSYAGGISGSSDAMIINCYSFNNEFYPNESRSYIGSIIGKTSNDKKTFNIRNCYIYHNQNTSYWYAAIGYTQNASIRSFYYNMGELNGGELGTRLQNVEKYNQNFKFNGTHISDLLNNWIDTTGKESAYAKYTFNRWTTAPDGSPCFE